MNPSREQVDEVLADMARCIHLERIEHEQFGRGFHNASALAQIAKREPRITEAPQCWDEDEWRDQAFSRHRRKYGRGIVLAVVIMAGCVLAIIGVLYAVKHGWLS